MMPSAFTPAAAAVGAPKPAPRECLACGAAGASVFFRLPDVPAHCNMLWESREEALGAVRGIVELAVCGWCGLVFNAAFDPTLLGYGEAYENSLYGSARFRDYASSLVERLAGRFALTGKLVVEIGCGKGEFLRQLCRHSGARGLGIDTSYDRARDADAAGEEVRFVQEHFERLDTAIRPDLICFRQVLEHIADPRAFMDAVAAAARRVWGCAVFAEVPNALFTLRDLGVFDILYEHCGYYTAPALSALFGGAGLNVLNVYPAFGDQYLCVEARAARGRTGHAGRDGAAVAELCTAFGRRYTERIERWADRLAAWRLDGRRVAVWGAGTKGVMFVNTVPGGEHVECLVDVNPRKRGRYVPGTGQQVVAPAELAFTADDVVITMNRLYREEISKSLSDLHLECRVDHV